jgi:hypothetical protein
VQTIILKNTLPTVGQGALGVELWNPGGGGSKKVWESLHYNINQQNKMIIYDTDYYQHFRRIYFVHFQHKCDMYF